MSLNTERLRALFEKFIQNTCTKQELEELWQLLSELSDDDTLSAQLEVVWQQTGSMHGGEERVNKEKIFQSILQRAREREIDYTRLHGKPRWRRRWAIAAVFTGIIILGYALFLRMEKTPLVSVATGEERLKNDIKAGTNKATLTLSNGTMILLDSAHKETLAHQGNMKVMKVDSGQLVYGIQPSAQGLQAIQFNTLSTPRGGQYKLELADGTKVWLNAASSIRFPTAFTNKERRVEVSGELYFEVTQKADQPFTVSVNGLQIEVLGTHFNIKAYKEEPVFKATLVEGIIKIARGNSVVLTLKPGEQLQQQGNGWGRLIKNADVEETIAWKNGLFVFHNENLSSVMRKLARWYDVEVSYREHKVPESHFTGAIERKENIAKVLKMLELAGGVHFEIAGRKIIASGS